MDDRYNYNERIQQRTRFSRKSSNGKRSEPSMNIVFVIIRPSIAYLHCLSLTCLWWVYCRNNCSLRTLALSLFTSAISRRVCIEGRTFISVLIATQTSAYVMSTEGSPIRGLGQLRPLWTDRPIQTTAKT